MISLVNSSHDWNQSLRCAFCSDVMPSTEAMQKHLYTCGNKTEPCPICRKYVRRAIFAYHYENNCANLEEDEEEQSVARNGPHRLIQYRAPMVYVTCPFYRTNHKQTESRSHKASCDLNPKNRATQQWPSAGRRPDSFSNNNR